MSCYDIVVKNGLVIDPSQGIHEVMDVAVSNGVIVDVGRGINASRSRHVIDASGDDCHPGFNRSSCPLLPWNHPSCG